MNTFALEFKSLVELLDFFKEEKTCYDFLAQRIWQDGKIECPHCRSQKIYTTQCRSKKGYKKGIIEYRCSEKACEKKFTATTKTIFHSTKIPLRYWYGAIFLLLTSKKGISSRQIATQLDISQRSTWFMMHRIREMLKEDEPEMLGGTVQADEAFVGGKNKNRHNDKKVRRQGFGRDYNDKTPVVGLLQQDGIVRTFVTSDTQQETLHQIIKSNVEKGSVLVTDDYHSYYGLEEEYTHYKVKHKEWFCRNDKVYHTNSIEGFWGIFKRGMIGIYNYVYPRHLQRYCNEFAHRYNFRNHKAMNVFSTIISKAKKHRLTYNMLTGKKYDWLFHLNPDKVQPKTGYEWLDDFDIKGL